MATTTFDTLKYFNKMKAAGIPEEHAQIQAEALQELVEGQLVTRSYFDFKLAELDNKLENKIEAAKHEILKWVMGFLLAQTALILGVVSFLR